MPNWNYWHRVILSKMNWNHKSVQLATLYISKIIDKVKHQLKKLRLSKILSVNLNLNAYFAQM